MTTITPPTSPQPLPSTPGAAPVVVVQRAPPALARLVIGQLLEATIISQTAKNTFQVQTPMGQLSLQSALSLPKGGALVMQLQSQSPFVQFQIDSLNGAAPPLTTKAGKGSPQTTQAQGNVTVSTSQAQGAPATKLATGNVLQATLMRPLSQAPGSAAQAPLGNLTSPVIAAAGLATGKGPSIQKSDAAMATSTKPSTAPATATSTAVKNATGMHNLNAPKVASGSTPHAPGYLPTGSQMSVKITAIQLPNPAAASAAPASLNSNTTTPALSAGTSLKGTVTGSTPSGHPIVQTRAGVFALTTQTIVPRGSTISLDVVNAPLAPTNKGQGVPTLHESLFTSRKWPALEQAFLAMEEAGPGSAQQLTHAIVPRPGAGLTSSVIFFLSALKGGDLRSWLGENSLRLIARSRPNIVGRIREDFTTLSRMADEPASGDWRVALIPINTGAEIEQIRLLLRQNDEETDEDATSDTRFIIDVGLSRFGRLQLDGLVRDKGKSLDLIVRSDAHLADTMQNDIRTIFVEAADLTGLKGGVNFQAAPADFINIPDPSSDHDVGLMV
jgi:hypothetical protein